MVLFRPDIPKWRSEYSIAPEIESKLRQIPWCVPILNDTSFVPILHHHHKPPPHLAGRYTFTGETLHTPRTIPIWETFYRPSQAPDDYGELFSIIELGPGMDGHPKTAHGGVAATLLDETAGVIGYMHKNPGTPIVTAYMNTNYRKTLPAPGLIMGKARLDGAKSGGRKVVVKASLEDGQGTVFTEAEIMFIEVQLEKL